MLESRQHPTAMLVLPRAKSGDSIVIEKDGGLETLHIEHVSASMVDGEWVWAYTTLYEGALYNFDILMNLTTQTIFPEESAPDASADESL